MATPTFNPNANKDPYAYTGSPDPSPVWANYKLVDEAGEEVALPKLMTAWNGEKHWVESFKPSRYQGNQGYIYTRQNVTLVPSVFKLKIVRI